MYCMTWGHFIVHLSLSSIFVVRVATVSFHQNMTQSQKKKSSWIREEQGAWLPSNYRQCTRTCLKLSSMYCSVLSACRPQIFICFTYMYPYYVCVYTYYMMARNMDILENQTPHLVNKGWEQNSKQTIKCTNMHWLWHPGSILLQNLLARIS